MEIIQGILSLIIELAIIAIRTGIVALFYICLCNCLMFKEQEELSNKSVKAVLVLGVLALFIA